MDKTIRIGLWVIIFALFGINIYWAIEVRNNERLYNHVKKHAYKDSCDITEVTSTTTYYLVFASRKYNEILTGKSKHVKGRTMFEINIKYTNYNTSNVYHDGYSILESYNEALVKLSKTNVTTCYYDINKNILEVTNKAIMDEYQTKKISSIVAFSVLVLFNIIFIIVLSLSIAKNKVKNDAAKPQVVNIELSGV